MNNINYNNFKNICRTCLFNCDLKSIQQNDVIIEILRKLGVGFETNDELPQQICGNCFEKLHEIREFSLRCEETYANLIKCLNNYKNGETKIKEEIICEEPNFEIVHVPNYFEDSTNLEIKQEINESNVETIEFVNVKNEDILKIKMENEQINKCYECEICDKTFTHPVLLKRHKTMHSGERPFACDTCNKTFNGAGTLRAHKRSHRLKRPPHVEQHSGERPHLEQHSGERSHLEQHSGERSHLEQHSGECPPKRDPCPKSFKFSHSGERPDECNVRTKSPNNPEATEHSGERPPFKCPVCQMVFNDSSELMVHQHQMHSNSSLLECDVCKKPFRFASDLMRHKRAHSGERPYECDVCGKAFKHTHVLKRHKKMMHSDERPFQCTVCKKTFMCSSELMVHQWMMHSNCNPYECDVCKKTFRFSSNLIRHKRIHSGERPYKCDVCHKGFIDSDKLKHHKKVHK